MALAGTLLSASIDGGRADYLIQTTLNGVDDEAQKRGKAKQTAEKVTAGENVTGLTRLCELLHLEGIQTDLRDWLQLEAVVVEVEKTEEHQEAIDKMNAEYFITRDGKREVFREAFDPVLNRKVLKKQSYPAFKDAYSTRYVQVGSKSKPMGDWWLKNTERRQFEDVYFLPGATNPDFYNLWPGWSYLPVAGTTHEAFLEKHVRGVICSGNQVHYDWLLGWLADLFQNPAEVGGTAIVLRGDPETGKGFFVSMIAKLLGTAFLHVSRGQHITGNFNAQLANRILVFLDEAIAAGDYTAEGALKTLITESTMVKEGKGLDATEVRSFLHLIIASNKDFVITSEMRETRRWFMVDVSDKVKDDPEHFKSCALNDAGWASLLDYLLNYDLSNWKKGKPPLTEALTTQKIASLAVEHPVDEMVHEMVKSGEVPIPLDEYNRFSTGAFAEYVRRRFPKKATALNNIIVGIRLGKCGLEKSSDGTSRKKCLPDTPAEARTAFEQALGIEINWESTAAETWRTRVVEK